MREDSNEVAQCELVPDLTAEEWHDMLRLEAPKVEWTVIERDRGQHGEQFMEVGATVKLGGEALQFAPVSFSLIGDRQKLAHAIAFCASATAIAYAMGQPLTNWMDVQIVSDDLASTKWPFGQRPPCLR